jgi:hypothetical protein
MRRYCFITGFLRSGTTLVEKMVHALPGACIGPQPFPFLYYDTKRAFLRACDLPEERYPLGHLFREERYRPEDFEAFLARHRLTGESVAASFAAMRGYSGWQLPAIAAGAGPVREGTFVDVYRQLCDRLPSLFGREAVGVAGAKEVFCEEFVPYFLREGVAVVLVVRDVRDVLTSLKAGSGATYGNRRLPILHIVRQWRKSVAFALQFRGTPGFELVRYEELVSRPRDALDRLGRQLGRPAAEPGALDDLRDQEGRAWEGNSSFAPARGVSRESVGRFADRLPASWLAVVEFLCAPEMAWMRMAPASPRALDDKRLEEAAKALATATDLIAPEQSLADEIDAERRRLRIIADGSATEVEQRRWCIFPRAYAELGRRDT